MPWPGATHMLLMQIFELEVVGVMEEDDKVSPNRNDNNKRQKENQMNRRLMVYGFGLLAWLLSATVAMAASTASYLMWQLPGGSSISLPVYVYQGGKQVAYIPSDSLQIFAGKYTAGKTNATYQLYYQDSSAAWHGCSLVIKKGSVVGAKSCPGAVINPPVTQNGATSNVYTAVFGATSWPALNNAPASPTALTYSHRTITFKNNTNYQMIQIGESCSTSNGKNKAPSCQNTPIVATINKGKSFVVTVGHDGLDSAAFYVSSYCTASSVSGCGTPPTVANCSTQTPTPPKNWVCTGGYFPGQRPYATKIEPTILTVTNGVPAGASNVDVSAVDGYSLGVRLYPSPAAYCTYTVPPENSNVLGAGYYGTKNPLAKVQPKKADSLSKLCADSSQLPSGYKGTDKAWDLSMVSAGGKFEGCMSPCTYAKANENGSSITKDTVDQFCCIGSYGNPSSCDAGKGKVGANTSTYNTNILNSAMFKNVYGFAYGDAGSDYACPPDTNFVVEFVSAPAAKHKAKKHG